MITFLDADLEKLYVFARHLRRLLRVDREELPLEMKQNIDMESYHIQQTASGKVALGRKDDKLDPVRTKEPGQITPEELEALSASLPISTRISASSWVPNTGLPSVE